MDFAHVPMIRVPVVEEIGVADIVVDMVLEGIVAGGILGAERLGHDSDVTGGIEVEEIHTVGDERRGIAPRPSA